ncbi:MAG TPA: hypothetical protein PLE48_02470 [Thiobacillus sp.]|nr:MAG: hypothetical protein B7Y50_13060 [Hydrogenophilales bacterium 28-61-11]OYZ58830.1 MAG: hypothetical protein B7Y21_01530 [Hydrogenophilales bacterium 16-61-112]OZA50907.1 MAG: hypothetical protein B7X81_01150 [Hydrogenophilales bacterium 17-61-76]HQT30158.1 hypothetical protein [Thiobacillus sp.]HQT69271.1 hypothetical protein [Thiobacillus sp.]
MLAGHHLSLALLCALALNGCALTVSNPRALIPLDRFVPLKQDKRVWVEPGYEAYGARVAAVLPAAIAQVEAAHYLPFARSPRVYVCGTAACFKRYVLTPKLSAAVVPDNRLILSPNLNNGEIQRLPALLVHELAHLHLGQRIGHYHSSLPVWFHEGWASLTAKGGGAEYVTDAQTRQAIRAGHRVNLTLRDLPGTRHRAASSRLGVFEFYRQSMLLVGWLKAQGEARFRQFVLAVQNNTDFEIAFWDVYGKGSASTLAGYYDEVLGDNPADDLPVQAAPAAPKSNPAP